MPMFRRCLFAAAAAATAAWAVPASAQQAPVKFTLDFVIQGPQAPFFLAAERGHYAKEGVNLTALDAGRGSADTVNRIASGAYDIGIGDINALIEFNAKNPGKELVAVMMYYDSGPFAIMTLRDKGIATPKDLAGKKAAAPSFDTPFRLFSLFAKATGIDPKSVAWSNVAPPLREPMLAQGQTDLISGFSFTSMLALRSLGVPESRLNVFYYRDYGVDLYSNAIIVKPEYAKANPKVVAGFVKATIKGMQETIAEPKAAIAAVKKREALLNENLEFERLMMAIGTSMITEDVKKNGLGTIRRDRMEQNIALVSEGFGLERRVTPEQVFDPSYLPPRAERSATR
ncbi:MAG: ABC transporter substrate-binding protein [Alphaproteobacteria bacterium]|nr:ABC transporter substrate-binding protein [Alphaproteobacteria bacterium]